MDRRTFLTATAGAAVALAVGGAASAAPPERVLFEWYRPGGFFNPGVGVFEPPPLAVYDDGTAFADAAASLRLPPASVRALRTQALRALSTPVDTTRGDRPTHAVRVLAADGRMLSAHLDAGPVVALPALLHDLYDEVQRLRRRVLRGEPWRPPAVLLATVKVGYLPDSSDIWPYKAPPDGWYAEQRLRGPAALDVQRRLPRAAEPVWPVYRVGPANYVAATWRYLLPHE
ncbi:hypothetical protein AB0J83_09675 [Actinoplanes sp. NPDC049596]|uniref:hypothetical protein n=1 Tax=unclassified Actinoplanes TaxID=2626549 RepID=UPI00343BDED4